MSASKCIITMSEVPKIQFTGKADAPAQLTACITLAKQVSNSTGMSVKEVVNIITESMEGTVVNVGEKKSGDLRNAVTIKHRKNYANIIWHEGFLDSEITDGELVTIANGVIHDCASMLGTKPINLVAYIMAHMKNEKKPTMRASISEETASKDETS